MRRLYFALTTCCPIWFGKTDLVDIKNDTLTYNVSSALIHDGEALDRLLIEIPGIEIDPSGNVHSTPSTQYTEYFKANGYHFSKGNGPVPCW